MSEYMVRALSPDTWDGFAGLAQRHNGVFGGCWCTYFHTMHSEKTFDADDNRSLKRRLVEEGRAQQDKADAQRDAGKKEAEAESARAGADAGVEIIGVTDQLPSADDIERVLVAVRSDRHDG